MKKHRSEKCQRNATQISNDCEWIRQWISWFELERRANNLEIMIRMIRTFRMFSNWNVKLWVSICHENVMLDKSLGISWMNKHTFFNKNWHVLNISFGFFFIVWIGFLFMCFFSYIANCVHCDLIKFAIYVFQTKCWKYRKC